MLFFKSPSKALYSAINSVSQFDSEFSLKNSDIVIPKALQIHSKVVIDGNVSRLNIFVNVDCEIPDSTDNL